MTWSRFLLFFAVLIFLSNNLHAQSNNSVALCFEDRYAKNNKVGRLMGIQEDQAVELVEEVAQALGVSNDIKIRECSFVENAVAWVPPDGSGIPKGRYIVFNRDWARTAAGRNRWQAIAIFGHELGHFVQGHFFERSNIDRRIQEREADKYAGCAVARLGGPWSALQDFFERIRTPNGSASYPSQEESLVYSNLGFSQCGDLSPEEWVDISPKIKCVGEGIYYGPGEIKEVYCDGDNCRGYLIDMRNLEYLDGGAYVFDCR